MRPLHPLRLTGVILLTGIMATCTPFDMAAPVSPKAVATKPPPKKTVAKAPTKPAKPQKAEPPAAESAPEIAREAAVAESPVETSALAEPQPLPQPQSQPSTPVPVDLVGKTEGEVLALLGQPNAESSATPGKILSFAGGGCAIDVHLFPDIRQGGFRALELISKSRGVAADHCAGRIRSMRG